MTAVVSSTVIAVSLIGVAGAALLTGHATFDQFIAVTASFGGATSLAHLFGSSATTSMPPAASSPPPSAASPTHTAAG